MAAASIDSTSRLRSVSSGVRPRPITITRYTATTTAVSPVADTVCTSTRSTRREIRGLVPAASASGTRAVAAAADLGGVAGPVDEHVERGDHQGDLEDHRHRAADELQALPGQARGPLVGLVRGGEADEERERGGQRHRRHRRDAIAERP